MKPNADVTPDPSHMSGTTGAQGSLLQDDPFEHVWLNESRPGHNRSRAVTQDVNTATRKGLFSLDWPKWARPHRDQQKGWPLATQTLQRTKKSILLGARALKKTGSTAAPISLGSHWIQWDYQSHRPKKPQEPKAQRGLYLSWAGPLSNTPLFPYKSSRTTATFRCNIHQTVRLQRRTQQTETHEWLKWVSKQVIRSDQIHMIAQWIFSLFPVSTWMWLIVLREANKKKVNIRNCSFGLCLKTGPTKWHLDRKANVSLRDAEVRSNVKKKTT